VEVSLAVEDGQAVLQVHDDGRGFDPQAVGTASRGLAGMRFRLESCAGSLVLQARPGQGTRIFARVPHAPPDSRPGLLMDAA
jgi:signal transduction histidine kinase